MRELVLTVPRDAVEDVLDSLLPIAPSGVREVPRGQSVELRMRGDELPSIEDCKRAAGHWRYKVSEHTVSDDWRERRLADYEPDVIGGRLVVRPEWAPPASPPLLDIVLPNTSAFGAATHPTTRTCVEQLLELEPSGSFADLGTGTGVLAIVAARLGWRPVVAVDVHPDSIEAVAVNAAANGAAVQVRIADLAEEAPPPANAIVANIPGWIHERVAAGLAPSVRLAVVSGFGVDEASRVLAAYAAGGMRLLRRVDPDGWVVAVLTRD
jgi:ribosomal protein L11 methyltransferase